MKKTKPEVSIIGTGRLGSALAIALAEEGYTIDALVARRRESARRAANLAASLLDVPSRVLALKQLADHPPSGLLLIATPDDQIPKVAEAVAKLNSAPGLTALHTSGALSSDVLAPLGKKGWSVGSLHPLVSVSEPRTGARLLRRAFWCVEGDKRAVSIARSIVRDLDGQSFSIDSSKKPLYHAAAVMVSGNVTTLFDVALEMLRQCGLNRTQGRRALLPLLGSAVDNLGKMDPVAALTGTFARGDVETVKRHLAALKGNEPILEIYRVLGQWALNMARARATPKLDPKLVKQIKRLIG